MKKKILPDTRYYLNKLWNNDDDVTFHSVCSTCSTYHGELQNLQGSVTCEMCDTVFDASNPSDSCFFAIVDPSKAIRELLEVHEDFYNYVMNERVHEKGQINDIYDGKLYRKFVDNLPDLNKNKYVTATINTDGAPVFKSSKFSINPIYIMLNELPVQSRFTNTIVTCIWFGYSKPEMSILLEIFVKKNESTFY